MAPDGSLLIADSNNRRVRRISPAGNIETIVGGNDDGPYGFYALGNAATGIDLDFVDAVTTSPDGVIYITQGEGVMLPGESRIETPGGLVSEVTTGRSITLADPDDPLSLQTLVDTVTVNGETYTRSYDASTRRFTLTTPEGRQRFVTHDAKGRPVRAETPGIAPIEIGYDSQGRLIEIVQGTAPERRTVTFGYGDEGWLDTSTDPLSRTHTFGRDAVGRTTQQGLPGDRTVEFSYDPNGNLISLTPPSTPEHGFGYTAVNLASTYDPPDVAGVSPGTSIYSYDLDRRLDFMSQPDGGSLTPVYDQDTGQLTSLVLPDGSWLSYFYTAPSGKLASVSGSNGVTVAHGYDGFLPISTTWSGEIAGSVSRTYDDDFRVVEQRVNGTDPVASEYDRDGLLIAVGSLALARDPMNGLLTDTTLGQVTTRRDFDAYGALAVETAAFAGTDIYRAAYTRDAMGRIEEKTEMIGGVMSTWGYQYDTSGRLVAMTRDGSPFSSYTYDGNGNRLTYDGHFGAATGTYDAQDRLLAYGATSYTYTAAGEQASKSQGSPTVDYDYDYDALGSLRSVTLSTGLTIDYVVDGQTRRVGKKIGGALVRDGATYRIVSDHLGSVRLVVDVATGEIAQRLDFDAFGRITLDTNPAFQPFGFAGGPYDPQTGLVRFGARDYDPELGRWTAKDPIRFEGGDTNLYAYAANDPILAGDVDGLAQRCTRPLDSKGGKVLDFFYAGPGSSEALDRKNREPLHEHFWFDDGNNRGFFGPSDDMPGGVKPDGKFPRDDYTCSGRQLDEATLYDAIANVGEPHEYQLLGGDQYNCQDWVSDVMADYERLRFNKTRSTGNDPETDFVWNKLLSSPP